MERIKVTQFVNLFANKAVISFMLLVLIVASIIDTSVIRLSFFTGGSNATWNIIGFSILAVVYSVIQYFIIRFVKIKINIHDIPSLNIFHRLVSSVQYFLIGLFVVIILQMITTSSYNLLLLKLIVYTSSGLGILLLGFLAKKFFSWFASSRNAILILYGIAMGMLVINIAFMMAVVINGLNSQSEDVKYYKNLVARVYIPNNVLNQIYALTSVLSFIFVWVATVMLLRYHSKKIGKAKYWIMVSVPLFYFLSQFQGLFFDLFESYRLDNPVLFGIVFTMVFTLSKPIGGILFGLAFWVVSRGVSKHVIKDYLIISGFGIALLFTSNQTTSLIVAPYPPFGLLAVALISLSSYLLLAGIYSSAMSISRDTELRKFIHKTAEKEIKLLDSIGFAEVERGLVTKIVPLVHQKAQKMEQETGIKTSLTDIDIKQYIDDIMTEVKKTKK